MCVCLDGRSQEVINFHRPRVKFCSVPGQIPNRISCELHEGRRLCTGLTTFTGLSRKMASKLRNKLIGQLINLTTCMSRIYYACVCVWGKERAMTLFRMCEARMGTMTLQLFTHVTIMHSILILPVCYLHVGAWSERAPCNMYNCCSVHYSFSVHETHHNYY